MFLNTEPLSLWSASVVLHVKEINCRVTFCFLEDIAQWYHGAAWQRVKAICAVAAAATFRSFLDAVGLAPLLPSMSVVLLIGPWNLNSPRVVGALNEQQEPRPRKPSVGGQKTRRPSRERQRAAEWHLALWVVSFSLDKPSQQRGQDTFLLLFSVRGPQRPETSPLLFFFFCEKHASWESVCCPQYLSVLNAGRLPLLPNGLNRSMPGGKTDQATLKRFCGAKREKLPVIPDVQQPIWHRACFVGRGGCRVLYTREEIPDIPRKALAEKRRLSSTARSQGSCRSLLMKCSGDKPLLTLKLGTRYPLPCTHSRRCILNGRSDCGTSRESKHF